MTKASKPSLAAELIPAAQDNFTEADATIVKDAAWIEANAPKIAIVGTTAHRDMAPFNDPTWEIWAQAAAVPRWSRWFELHDFRRDDQNVPRDCPGLWQFMLSFDGSKPCYMRPEMIAAHPEIKGAIPYPLEDQVKRFNTWFFSSTVAFELSLAITEIMTWREKHDVDSGGRIALYGIDMADNTEYSQQKPGCRALVYQALTYNIPVTVPEQCELLTPGKLYVLGEFSWLEQKLWHRYQELTERINAARNVLAQLDAEYQGKANELRQAINTLTGAIQEVDHHIKNWCQ